MFHLRAIEDFDDVEVVAVADLDERRVASVKEKSGADVGYIDYRELLSDPKVDAVVINTPPRFHEEMVISALKSGKHVMCEKPLAQSVEGCIHIKKVQEATDRVVLPAHNYAFTPSMEKVQELVQSNAVGRVERMSLKFENNLRGYRSRSDFRLEKKFGIVEDILPHILSVTQGIVGRADQLVNVRAWRKRYDVIDNINILLRTNLGVDLYCTASWTKLIPCFKVIVSGKMGKVETDLMWSPFSVSVESDGIRKKIAEKRGFKLYLDLIRFKHPSFKNLYSHLLELVEEGESPRNTIDDELSIIGMIEEVVGNLSET